MIRKTNKKVTALALIMILVMSIVLSACGDDKTNYEKISKDGMQPATNWWNQGG